MLTSLQWQVETRTKSDINDKGRQLQQLVGGSYRYHVLPLLRPPSQC